MSRLTWVSAVLALVVLAALGLRWALADFLLDQFGSLPDSLTRAQHPKRSASLRIVPSRCTLLPDARRWNGNRCGRHESDHAVTFGRATPMPSSVREKPVCQDKPASL